MPVRREVGAADIGDLALVRAVGVHHMDFELPRPQQPLRQEAQVVVGFGPLFRVVRPPHDPLAVGREEGAAVVAGPVGEPPHVGTVRRHRIEVEVAVAGAGEDDAVAHGREGRLGVVAGRRRELARSRAVQAHREDVVALVDRPHVPLREIGLGRARGVVMVRRGVQDLVAGGVEVGARRAALAGAGHARVARLGIEQVDLVAAAPRLAGLEHEPRAIEGPVRLGVFATESQLAYVAEMGLARHRERGVRLVVVRGPGGVSARAGGEDQPRHHRRQDASSFS